MKKLKNYLSLSLSFIGMFLIYTKNALADIAPLKPVTVKVPKPSAVKSDVVIPVSAQELQQESTKSFFELIQPQHIIIGLITVGVIIIIFIILKKTKIKK